jgi:hypothetical protein
MTIDQAVAVLGAAHIRSILRSGRAFDVAADSFNGRAITAQIRRDFRRSMAYYVVAACDEPLLWQAIRPVDELRAAYLEGSVKARRELDRRRVELPGNAVLQPAWL